ncbi:MAG: class II fructose-bisphosphate aldolase [Bowdeniella nasicola]|nr:class II fructose-bisphosphate aldolase [Bowdeniella nasicola]
MLIPLAPVAEHAARAGTGLGAFNVIHLENAATFISAAERAGRPVVLQISQNAVAYHGGDLRPIGLGTLAAAREADVDVVVHLDHATDEDLCRQAIDLGFTSVMYDGSTLPDAENREATARVVAYAHERGVSVEAELGEVGGKDGVHDPSARTDPADAAQFVADTGVDLLAVAVGSSHAMTTRGAELDLERITAIRDALDIPLVLHGSSGVSDAGMVAAIRAGMTKINVSTHLTKVFTETVREVLAENPELVDTRKWFTPAAQAQGAEAERLLRLYATA